MRTRAPILLALALLSACGGDASTDVVVADSAGLRLVSNHAPDAPLDWRLDPVLRLGGRDEGPEAFYSVGAGSVGTDAAGNLYVMDRDGHRVVVFDGEGRHLRTLGREGSGPGELQLPFGLTVKPDGTVLVDDLGKGRLVGFAPDGAPLDREEPVLPGSRRVFGDGGFHSALSDSDEEGFVHRLLWIAGTDTTELSTSRSPAGGAIELKSCGMSFSGLPPIFDPGIAWDAWSGRGAVRHSASYEIDVYEGPLHVARFRRAVPPEAATTDLAMRSLGEAMTVMTSAGPRECDPAETVEQRGFADVVPAIRGLRVDPAGRIWVARGGPRAEATPTDVLAADGTYLGTLAADVPFPIGFLPDGRALGVETDELDVDRLVVYEVREAPVGPD